MRISDILRHKGTVVHTLPPQASIHDLLAALAEHGIGAVLVTEGDILRGIVSERDVVRRLTERGADLLDSTVEQIMTNVVVTCRPDDTVDAIAQTMTERRVRHMPVLEGERIAGIVSIGDVVSSRMRQLEHDRGHLEQYISG